MLIDTFSNNARSSEEICICSPSLASPHDPFVGMIPAPLGSIMCCSVLAPVLSPFHSPYQRDCHKKHCNNATCVDIMEEIFRVSKFDSPGSPLAPHTYLMFGGVGWQETIHKKEDPGDPPSPITPWTSQLQSDRNLVCCKIRRIARMSRKRLTTCPIFWWAVL
jgi:hypothetical protein